MSYSYVFSRSHPLLKAGGPARDKKSYMNIWWFPLYLDIILFIWGNRCCWWCWIDRLLTTGENSTFSWINTPLLWENSFRVRVESQLDINMESQENLLNKPCIWMNVALSFWSIKTMPPMHLASVLPEIFKLCKSPRSSRCFTQPEGQVDCCSDTETSSRSGSTESRSTWRPRPEATSSRAGRQTLIRRCLAHTECCIVELEQCPHNAGTWRQWSWNIISTFQRDISIPQSQHITLQNTPPQAPDMFNPEVGEQTCGIIPKLYETKHKSNMRWIKSVVKGFSKIQPKMSKKNTF